MSVVSVLEGRTTRRPRPPELDDRSWLEREYIEERRTTVEIAEELCTSPQVTSMALKRLGIPVRNGGTRLPD